MQNTCVLFYSYEVIVSFLESAACTIVVPLEEKRTDILRAMQLMYVESIVLILTQCLND